MSSRARIGIVLAAAVVLVVAFVVAKGGGDDDKDTPTVAQTTPAPAATTEAETEDTPAGETTTATTAPEPAQPAIPTITVEGGKPKGGVEKLEFTKGDTIRFRVKSDVAEEIHFHGYDVAKDVEAGGSVRFSVPGKIDGRFEVELEHSGVQIAEIRVNPS